jgi:hypothetical protein
MFLNPIRSLFRAQAVFMPRCLSYSLIVLTICETSAPIFLSFWLTVLFHTSSFVCILGMTLVIAILFWFRFTLSVALRITCQRER